jgi:hypothetical protein
MDIVMYTLHMSWPFRGLVLAVLLGWGLAPQLVCFMPDQTPTSSEMDCCKGMAADCNDSNMSQACCQTVVRTDIGIAAKTDHDVKPRVQTESRTIAATVPVVIFSFDPPGLKQSDHTPPPSASSLILRI